jgi:hypothetical protein
MLHLAYAAHLKYILNNVAYTSFRCLIYISIVSTGKVYEVWNQKVTWNDKPKSCLNYNWNLPLKHWNMFYNSRVTLIATWVRATYQCHICNTSIKHVEHHSETLETCTLQQQIETTKTRWWNNWCIILFYLFSSLWCLYTNVTPK